MTRLGNAEEVYDGGQLFASSCHMPNVSSSVSQELMPHPSLVFPRVVQPISSASEFAASQRESCRTSGVSAGSFRDFTARETAAKNRRLANGRGKKGNTGDATGQNESDSERGAWGWYVRKTNCRCAKWMLLAGAI